MGLLRVECAARGVHAGASSRELHRAALRATAAQEAGHVAVLAPGDRLRRAVVTLGAHAPVDLDHAAVGQESQVIAIRVPSASAPLTPRADGAGARPVARSSNASQPWPKLASSTISPAAAVSSAAPSCSNGMRDARVAARAVQIVLDRLGTQPGRLGNGRRETRRTLQDESIDRRGGNPGFGTDRRDRARHDLQVALVAHPALLERVIEAGIAGAVMIDEVVLQRGYAEQFGGEIVARAHQHRRGAVSVRRLLLARRLRDPAIGRDDQRVARQIRATSAWSNAPTPARCWPATIGDTEVLRQVQRRGDHARIRAVSERMGRRREGKRGDRAAIATGQAVTSGLDSHRQAVFIPVAATARAARCAAARACCECSR